MFLKERFPNKNIFLMILKRFLKFFSTPNLHVQSISKSFFKAILKTFFMFFWKTGLFDILKKTPLKSLFENVTFKKHFFIKVWGNFGSYAKCFLKDNFKKESFFWKLFQIFCFAEKRCFEKEMICKKRFCKKRVFEKHFLKQRHLKTKQDVRRLWTIREILV